jgi:hypothetical protein
MFFPQSQDALQPCEEVTRISYSFINNVDLNMWRRIAVISPGKLGLLLVAKGPGARRNIPVSPASDRLGLDRHGELVRFFELSEAGSGRRQ